MFSRVDKSELPYTDLNRAFKISKIFKGGFTSSIAPVSFHGQVGIWTPFSRVPVHHFIQSTTLEIPLKTYPQALINHQINVFKYLEGTGCCFNISVWEDTFSVFLENVLRKLYCSFCPPIRSGNYNYSTVVPPRQENGRLQRFRTDSSLTEAAKMVAGLRISA